MAKKMLIDATHAEETRVVVVDGNKVEEFDFESENKRQLAGNIYLAKVTRVEPSLQAAFIDYGGNRHGFLAFSEIHPDYYQIPVADREALLAEEREFAQAEEAEEDRRSRGGSGSKSKSSRSRSRSSSSRSKAASAESDEVVSTEASIPGMDVVDLGDDEDQTGAAQPEEGTSPAFTVQETPVETPAASEAEEDVEDDQDRADSGDAENSDPDIESVADEDVTEEIRQPRKPRARKYKIQEVIKVRQVMLVQVVKEERGNKGAALTTYLSLAGRYCVLMPNTARGGGISRKITNAADRKKLKEIANEIEVPDGAGLIIRTAGAQRTKAEIKRDYEYLQRLWEQIRELTLKSIAPAKIYEEGDLIKRSIRDLYNKDIDEVFVEGEAGYRSAKDFMKMIMPSHSKNVKLYTETMPLFARYQVESYLAGMFNPTVQLKSGGYIVIGVTEALVAIDVNSGRATKEGSIEQTALNTNLEAAEEVARQLRLRDLAGLIVIDFIDMEERKNNAAVEKRFKDKLKTDRARIQVGRISGFGLLEMSRQRLRPGMLEATTAPCSHCHGTGLVRSDDSLALTILRQLEEEGTRKRSKEVLLKAPIAIANFLMNQKREHIQVIEQRYGMAVRIEADPTLISPDFSIEKFKTATRSVPEALPVISGSSALMDQVDEDEDQVVEDESETEEGQAQSGGGEQGDGPPKKKRRRRRRRKSGSSSGQNGQYANGADQGGQASDDRKDGDGEDSDAERAAFAAAQVVQHEDAPAEVEPETAEASAEAEAPAEKPKSRTVSRSSLSRSTSAKAAKAEEAEAQTEAVAEPSAEPAPAAEAEPAPEAEAEAEAPAKKPSTRKAPAKKTASKSTTTKTAAKKPAAKKPSTRTTKAKAAEAVEPEVTETAPDTAEEAPKPKPKPATRSRAKPKAEPKPEAEPVAAVAEAEAAPAEAAPAEAAPAEAAPVETVEEAKPKKRGWWSLGR
ncbi:Rne/Rng family ribonuclease [Frigidibacter sp. ROC022]|uniref:Rne/Rng family ribonuclease n=1 Tax=Frigidibacter sp. ROC022 TaxID=2971796 RepID=UPI00215B42FC|nr:ribonuclease E/G [Frigidibacter sp. ROC022]MCR8723574.1 ribonuclease E/G [Frigidibacter sp. ROC022]